MKKIILMVLPLLLGLNLSAQLQFGIKGGLSTTEINPQDIRITGDGGADELVIALENANYGIQGGVLLRAQIGTFFIQPELLYTTSSADYRISDFRTSEPYNDILRERYHYLDIPVMLGFKLGALRLQGGPVGHLFINSPTELTDISGYEQNFDEMSYGWQAGAAVDIWKFVIDARYEGNFNRFGDHITIFGNEFDFRRTPGRIIGSVGFVF